MSDTTTEYLMQEPVEDVAASLTFRERALRDRFVQEYFVDYDEKQAAIRIGYSKQIADEYAVRLMQCPYVAQQMRKHEVEDAVDSDEKMNKRIINGLIREAHYKGPGSSPSARVAALAKLASIQGLDKPSTKDPLVDADGNPIGLTGVFVVPGIATPEDWARIAAKQQDDLVNGRIAPVQQAH